MKNIFVMLLALALSTVFTLAHAAESTSVIKDWPQFLGPDRNGTSPETGLARSWPPGGPKVLWTVSLGQGFGGAAVRAGRVYVLDREGATQDILRCFDLEQGKELWRFAYDAPGKVDFGGSRTVPAVDDRFVFISGPFGQFHCLDLKTQTVVWKTNLVKEFDGKIPMWGLSQNPLLMENLVIVAPQGRKAGIVAFDKATGRLVWKSPFFEEMMAPGWSGSYASPMPVILGGVQQILFATSQSGDGKNAPPGRVFGVSAQDGSVLWSHEGWRCPLTIVSPMSPVQDHVFLTGAYDAGSWMLKIEKSGSKFTVAEVFKTLECGSIMQQPILYNGHLYVISNGQERREGLMCLSIDGKVLWHTTNSKFVSKAAAGLPNFDAGNLLLADGLLFILDGKTGDLRLVGPNPQGYKELAVLPAVLSGKQIWAPMALADGRLIIRDQTQMKCLDVRR
ncbi:MAG: PQQ-binding-like beta-propeller repeat protein [bacterium]